eukprot:TRINITY_DN13653_c0_g1_i1.p1 TRINITY_DN13653_c0_g1~~TRINITY_DN13653_c0_g1_i1.p1  ORF type:complete len:357 (-),score=113.53 TRINITY_DN13653_c0_g1_i1:197-1267(-)
MSEVSDLRAALEQKQQELQTAGEMGKMLVEKCESISKEAAEQHAQFAEEMQEMTQNNEALATRVNELETVNESTQSKNAEYASVVRDLESELEAMREENQSNAGDASDAARRAKAELEIKCRELQEQVNEYQVELDKAKQQAEVASKSLTKTKSELAIAQEKNGESESLREKLELEVQEKDNKIRSLSRGHSDQTEDDERHYKEQLDNLLRDKDDVLKKVSELSEMNNILAKQHDEDQTLLEDVKATNVMLREALETKELEWGNSADNNLASFAPKESLLGEIEQHFNRFSSFGSPQKSSKMPNFMDVVKRDFENLAHRIHRLRQKMEKKWPDPPPAAGADSPAPVPKAAEVVESQ